MQQANVDIWGIRKWNAKNGRILSGDIGPGPETVVRELIETGAKHGYDWSVIWRRDFNRYCIIERPWTADALERMIEQAEDPSRSAESRQMCRYAYQFFWHNGVVKWPLVNEDDKKSPNFGAPRAINRYDISAMMALRPEGPGEDPLKAMREENERLVKFREKQTNSVIDDSTKFMKDGYRFSRPSEMPEYICEHSKRSRACPACNPKTRFFGSARAGYLTDADLSVLKVEQ